MSDRIVVLDGHTLNPGDLSWAGLQALGQLTVYDRTQEDQIVERASGCRLVLTNKTPIRADVLARLPGLGYIGVLATGYDVVDVAATRERGIVVTNVPTYGTNSVAQHAVALMLEIHRQVGRHSQAVRSGRWATSADWCFALTPISELTGRVLGVVGMGRIGRALARIGVAFGMSILAHDEYPPSADALAGLEAEFTDIDDVFRRADIISLHCPLTPETNHLVNARRLALMKSTAVLINTSRGQLVDNRALADALVANRIFGAGLDVLDVEPPPADNPLLAAPNCIITPHIAWYAREARQRLLDIAVGNLRAFLNGEAANVV